MNAILYTEKTPLMKRIREYSETIRIIDAPKALDSDAVILTDPESVPKIRRHHPHAAIMVLSALPSFEEGSGLLQSGIRGYGNMYMHFKHLKQAIEAIESGNIWLYPEFMQQLITHAAIPSDTARTAILEQLTRREQETALLVKEGLTNKEIASKLQITERTVKQHLSNIYEKLGISDRFTLAVRLR